MISNRVNRRKTTKARRTQVVDVPMFIIRSGLKEEQLKQANFIKEGGIPSQYPDLFIPNPSRWAGKRKFIFHQKPGS